MKNIKKYFRSFLETANVAVTKQETFDRLITSEQKLKRYDAFLLFAARVSDQYLKRALSLLPESKGEIFQDIFVALILNEKRGGFFVEFGATDGVIGNNTWLLEQNFSWNGLLAEPARVWHEQLAKNRSCIISHDCVWTESGRNLEFRETSDAGFSSLSDYAGRDRHVRHRADAKIYDVRTVSLDDLLKSACAPRSIDFMSIDTEGSEYDILRVFPFEDWNISLITVEHNFRADRDNMHSLLRSKGFVRVLTDLSQFDDWYVSEDLAPQVAAVFHDCRETFPV